MFNKSRNLLYIFHHQNAFGYDGQPALKAIDMENKEGLFTGTLSDLLTCKQIVDTNDEIHIIDGDGHHKISIIHLIKNQENYNIFIHLRSLMVLLELVWFIINR